MSKVCRGIVQDDHILNSPEVSSWPHSSAALDSDHLDWNLRLFQSRLKPTASHAITIQTCSPWWLILILCPHAHFMSSCILQLDRITGRNHERNKYSPCRCACVFSHPRNNDCSSRRRSEDEDILLTNLLSSPPLFDHAVSVDCRSSPIQLQTDLPPYSLHTHTHTPVLHAQIVAGCKLL